MPASPSLKIIRPDIYLVIFDLEGVLVENMPYELHLQAVAKATGVADEALQRHYGTSAWKNIDHAHEYHLSLANHEEARAAIQASFVQFQELKAKPRVLPQAIQVLATVRARGIELICWTRGKQDLQNKVLQESGLAPHFDQILITDNKSVQTTAERLSPVVTSDRFAMVGDIYASDMEPFAWPAMTGQCQRIWVTGSQAGAFHPPSQIAEDVIRINTVGDLLKSA